MHNRYYLVVVQDTNVTNLFTAARGRSKAYGSESSTPQLARLRRQRGSQLGQRLNDMDRGRPAIFGMLWTAQEPVKAEQSDA